MALLKVCSSHSDVLLLLMVFICTFLKTNLSKSGRHAMVLGVTDGSGFMLVFATIFEF